MDKKKDTPAEVETVTVTMSRPVAEAVQAACEMYLRLHMGQFNDLAEDLCMAKHYADMDASGIGFSLLEKTRKKHIQQRRLLNMMPKKIAG